MVMAEYEVIHGVFSSISLSKLIQRLLSPLEHIFLVTRQTIAPRPSIAEAESHTRMKHAEETLSQTVMEEPAKETVSERNRAQTVSVPQTETLAPYLDQSRLNKLLHTQLLEIAVCPYIVVSLEEIHLHSPVHKILKSGKYTDIPFRHHIPVLIPEIPYVAKQIKSLRILGKRTQEAGKAPLAVRRVIDLKTEMDIRDKICTAALFHVMVEDPSLRSG